MILYFKLPSVCMHDKSLQSCPTLYNPMDCSPPDSSAHGIPREEYWSGLPFLLQGIFLTLRSNPCLSYLLHWEVSSLPLAPPEKPIYMNVCMCNLTDIKHQHRWTYISAYSSKNPECTLWSNL